MEDVSSSRRPRVAPLLTPRAARLLSFGLAVLLTSFGSAAVAQDPEAGFRDRVDVRVVNVEAVVTDRQGNRVTGLDPSAFQLTVDGRPVDIDFFNEIRGGQIVRTGSDPVTSISPEQSRGTSYLVFLDEYFTVAADRNRVLRNLEEELNYLGPADRMAIVAWDGFGLDMLSSWTSSERELRSVLRRAESRPSRGLERIAERKTALSGLRFATSRAYRFGSDVDLVERAYIERLMAQTEAAVDASSAALRAFAFPPGRKVMVLASSGWPFSAADSVVGQPYGLALLSHYERDGSFLRPLIDTANLLGYTLYPVDAAGVEGDEFQDASRAFPRRPEAVGFGREEENEAAMRALARETGGRALIDGGARRALSRVQEDTRSFYWLGFAADRTEDGVRRRIEVSVDVPKLRVRTREHYTDLSHETEVATAVESALLFGHPIGRESLDLELGHARRDGFRRMTVPLTVRIPAAEIAHLPHDGELAAELEVRVAARDRRGNLSDVPLERLFLQRESPPEVGEDLVYETTLHMRREEHDVIVAVYDAVTGELWSAVATVARPAL